MPFAAPPPFAAWQHRDSRAGFEVVFLHRDEDGYRLEGATSALEGGEPWAVQYVVAVDSGWTSRSARVSCRSRAGPHELRLEAAGSGPWRVNGAPDPHLDGCLDVDLESSALTNAFPVHRLGLEVGEQADAPAVWVRAIELTVERLEQRYVRLEDDGKRQRYHYSAPRFEFESELLYDESGLIVDYPGIAIRAA
jgi:hypothetical protein